MEGGSQMIKMSDSLKLSLKNILPHKYSLRTTNLAKVAFTMLLI